jgi:hypothetical protein
LPKLERNGAVYGAIAIVKRVEESDADMIKLELADLGVHRK